MAGDELEVVMVMRKDQSLQKLFVKKMEMQINRSRSFFRCCRTRSPQGRAAVEVSCPRRIAVENAGIFYLRAVVL
jgi:hypothetical protein